jgi:rhamnosyltransferase
MTSGSLVKTSAFASVGMYDEGMFIDYVDFDFCLRLWQHGCKVIRSCHSCLLHHLGSLEAYSFLGFPITITSHNAVRRYYIMRNRVIMYKRYASAFPFWVIKDFAWLCLDITKIIVFEHDKRAKLGHAFKGLRHGMAGVTGPLVTAQM